MQKWRELAPLIGVLRHRKLKTVVEIGSARGGTLYVWCKLAAPDAVIVSIDLPGGPFGGHLVENDVQKLLAYGQPRQVLRFLRTNSHSPATLDKLMQILNGSPVDFLMIDGDHTYKGVKHDFDFYSPLVAPDGLIAFHDIVPALHNDACQVHVFWGEIKDRYRHIEFEEREGNRRWRSWGGIGVLDWSGEQIPRDTDSDPEAIELFITEEDAKRALEDCLRDEPQWRGRLKVTEVELDHQHTSLN